MNYRHAFHAGNFADVLKHAVLARILVHLRAKPAPFRVIDTHAGAGLYDLAGAEAARSGEWREGIARLLSSPIADGARALLAPYLDAVAALNRTGGLTTYPGSPALVRAFLRTQDRLTACELEPNAAAALARNLHGDRRSKAVVIDGWTALNAYVPPKERRGLVLIDPPYEQADDFPRLAQALEAAHRKWASGSYLLWYPIKQRDAPNVLARRLLRGGIATGSVATGSPAKGGPERGATSTVLRVELDVGRPRDTNRLGACGLMVVNPPWTLEGELAVLLPALAAALSGDGRSSHRVDWLRGEK
jgi:23S rRNA (adenine2030-N6)-methyltransferase